ncbi:FHA domain-containing protein [Phycicoccus flavus]|uniref:FHA domain-containing protein n=1 Tax=Phycicoccus flavus TaxID=2502783 RepID=A0A8T6R4P6_9MICO|nr:FHA domain-containing protein [Phycicoccus flavus]NHA68634.1 FHA domain-containing protein [Phycicoccus flavus]
MDHPTSVRGTDLDDPCLVFRTPERLRGRRVVVSSAGLLVGRGDSADLRLDDPYVSRTHARIRRMTSGVVVEDLGSTTGTTVNGDPADAATPLTAGDVVQFGEVQMVFQVGSSAHTRTFPAVAASAAAAAPAARIRPPGRAPGGGARFDLREQSAGVISNVGRDQHISYVAHVRQERESLLREIAATRTRARSLVWAGLVISAVGFGMFAYAILRTMARIGDRLGSPSAGPPDFGDFYGTPVLGVPSGLLGFAVCALGSVLLTFGIVLHVVASSRRRRLGRDLPHPYSLQRGTP